MHPTKLVAVAALAVTAVVEIAIAQGAQVTLYENANFGGASKTFSAPYDSTCYNIWDCFNDRATSSKWTGFGYYFMTDTLIFYADADCKGAKYAVTEDDHYRRGDTVANFGALNKRISSFSVMTYGTGITGYTGYKCSARRGDNETDTAVTEPMPVTGL